MFTSHTEIYVPGNKNSVPNTRLLKYVRVIKCNTLRYLVNVLKLIFIRFKAYCLYRMKGFITSVRIKFVCKLTETEHIRA